MTFRAYIFAMTQTILKKLLNLFTIKSVKIRGISTDKIKRRSSIRLITQDMSYELWLNLSYGSIIKHILILTDTFREIVNITQFERIDCF